MWFEDDKLIEISGDTSLVAVTLGGDRFTLKITKKHGLGAMEKERRKEVQNEVKVLRGLIGTPIEELIAGFKEAMESELYVYLRVGDCSQGSLQSKLTERFTEKSAISHMLPVIKVLVYLHSRNIAHRHISLDGIFLDEEGITKLGNFGRAQLNANEDMKAKDVLDFGYSIYSLLGGKCDRNQFLDGDAIFPFGLSDNAKSLLDSTRNKETTISDIEAHPWWSEESENDTTEWEQVTCEKGSESSCIIL